MIDFIREAICTRAAAHGRKHTTTKSTKIERRQCGQLSWMSGARVLVTEVDPICALQAAMDGFEVVTMEEAVKVADIFCTATGNEHVITAEHMKAMKDKAIVCNIGHFDSEIQISALDNYEWNELKPGTDLVKFPDGKEIIVLGKGRLVNLSCATGHPSFVMGFSFTNQTLAQINNRERAAKLAGTSCWSRDPRISKGLSDR